MVFVLSVTELHTLKRSADKNSDAVGVVSWGFHFGDHDHGGWSQQRPPPLPPPPDPGALLSVRLSGCFREAGSLPHGRHSLPAV